jgi:high-affinity Fe2+/Pb2+ permease
MNRSTTLLVIVVALAGYGVYAASYVPAMLVGPTVPALGVWRGQRWAAWVVVLLGGCIAGTWIFAGFILGIVAYLYALAVAVIALIVTLVMAAYVNRQRAPAKG